MGLGTARGVLQGEDKDGGRRGFVIFFILILFLLPGGRRGGAGLGVPSVAADGPAVLRGALTQPGPVQGLRRHDLRAGRGVGEKNAGFGTKQAGFGEKSMWFGAQNARFGDKSVRFGVKSAAGELA